MKLLVHACCGPCSVYPLGRLMEDEIDFSVFWYNPNIHPYMEYKNRKEHLEKLVSEINKELILKDEYGLREFCKNVVDDLGNRCSDYCYKVRLEETAKCAKENGYDSFTTTLLISPYQDHDELIRIGNEMAQKYDLTFYYEDFRIGFRKGQQIARQKQLYMQKYCGCIFSEEDRYLKSGGK